MGLLLSAAAPDLRRGVAPLGHASAPLQLLRFYAALLEKNTKEFRYDLNQIHYDYTVEVRNRFKGLDLIDRVPDGGS